MTSMPLKMREHSRFGVRTAWAGLLALASMLGGLQTATAGESFFDDFAHFDKDRWYISDGWSNGAHQNCLWSDAAVAHEEGRMSLYFYYDITPEHDYRCGEIQTRPRFGHGTFEARIRTNEGSGLNAAFFTYIGPVHGEPHDEIDFEVLTANTQEVTVNTYVDGEQFHGAVRPMPQPASEQFHTYSFIWEADRMRWFIDGKLIHSVEDSNLPERPQKIYLSIWGTETLNDWMGPFEHPQAPKRMDIDWVSYTAPGEACQFAGSVLCELAEN
ncbi:family 16 glycosylhydrolase [Roseinatronobacter sp.]|uniref:family 16 glycosylhydrolase n=1 Tax=Roseinatronobacter sp. TaxID=1945755 RepID=UPI0025FFD6D5|nr:family 16 glycosylhydrolase [Rhodobaca sp.]